MGLLTKLLALIFFVLSLPISALAEKADYVFVTSRFVNGTFEILQVEQKVFDSSSVIPASNGSYQIQLLNNRGIISKTFFEVNVEEPLEVISISRDKQQYEYIKSDTALITTTLPLTFSINVDTVNLLILKGDQILLDKRLSELPVSIAASKTYRIAVDTKSNDYPLLPAFPDEKNAFSGRLLWVIIGIGIIILTGLIIIIIKKTRKNKSSKPGT